LIATLDSLGYPMVIRVRVMVRFPCNQPHEIWSETVEFMGCPTMKPHDPMVISFDSILACDRQTDGQTC